MEIIDTKIVCNEAHVAVEVVVPIPVTVCLKVTDDIDGGVWTEVQEVLYDCEQIKKEHVPKKYIDAAIKAAKAAANV
tara:strand:- start:279 stop:509 length:231 start_codon:yes stop_codon:yes gene_type:complete